MHTDRPLFFLSYASPDRDRVLPFYDWLKAENYDAWIDCRKILPGQNWNFELNRAIDRATLILAFISKVSISRRGYVQRELKLALDRLKERLTDDIYIIPVLLDDVPLPPDLRSIQAISTQDSDCKDKILAALQFQLERLGHSIQKAQADSRVSWSKSVQKEEWDGLPGYRFELEFIQFTSTEYRQIGEASDYIRGIIGSEASSQRAIKLEQSPQFFNYGQTSSSRTNEFDAHCGTPSVKGRVLTVQYAQHWYSAGAAHPNYIFTTFSFLLDPLVRIPTLEFIFEDGEEALSQIQSLVRQQLLEIEQSDPDAEQIKLDPEWLVRGTTGWEDFGAFVFSEDGIDILFAPYQVAAYACGAQFAKLAYEDIFRLLKATFVTALGLEHLRYKASVIGGAS